MSIPDWLESGLWGFFVGSALVIGAAVGYWARPSKRVVATVMAFGSGVLISALAFDLMEEAYAAGGLWWANVGLLGGALLFTGANHLVSQRGAKHRKRSGDQQPSEDDHPGSGVAIALGSLLDGIPETLAIGLSLLGGKGLQIAAVIAIFLSNLPEGLSSAAGMRNAGRSPRYVLGLFLAIAVVCGISATLGYAVLGSFPEAVAAVAIAAAAGAVLAMIVDTMLPEAFAETHAWAGIVTTIGFLLAFTLGRLGG
jgi:ZIP family zinc transporter